MYTRPSFFRTHDRHVWQLTATFSRIGPLSIILFKIKPRYHLSTHCLGQRCPSPTTWLPRSDLKRGRNNLRRVFCLFHLFNPKLLRKKHTAEALENRAKRARRLT